MPQRLRIKRIDTVGFVDKGDDPEATVVFWKRADDVDKEESPMKNFFKALAEKVGMTSDEAEQLLADDGAGSGSNDTGGADDGAKQMEDLTKLQADLDAAKTRADEAEAKAAELEKLLAEATEPDPVPDPDPEVPEAVQKHLDGLQKRADEAEAKLAKEIDRRETETYIAKAKTLTDLPGANPDDFAGILRKIDGALDDDERAKFDEVMKGANAAVKAGALYKEIGEGGRGATSVEGEVATLAETIQKANPGMSAQVARGEVWKQNPALLTAYEAERKAAITKED